MDRQHGARGGTGDLDPPDLDPPDRELIDRVRAGEVEAYDPLYRRHERSALAHARHWTRTEAAAQDLRAEAFTRVLYALRNGNGPTEAFRPYLLTTMRHVARDWAEGERRVSLVADVPDLESPEAGADPVIAALERSLAGQAFMVLPEQWQTVLWHTEVEGEGPTDLAPLLGMQASAVAALAYRAREGLKQAYLQAHISEIGAEACRPYAGRLGRHARGRLGARDRRKVEEHLRHCAECAGLFAMLKYINEHIAVLIGPAVVGGAVAVKGLLLIAGGAAAGAATGAAAPAGLLARGAAKARHASPRQQAAAAAVAAAVIAGLAFALTGGAPAAKPRPHPKPAAAPPPSSAAPAPPPPSPPPPSPAPSASAPPRPTPKPPPPSPAPTPPPSTPPPGSPPPSSPAPPPPSPSPSPSPVRVNCPGIFLQVPGLITVQIGLLIEIGGGGVILATCPTGPPRPF